MTVLTHGSPGKREAAGVVGPGDLFDPAVGQAVVFVLMVTAVPVLACVVMRRLFPASAVGLPNMLVTVLFTGFCGSIVGMMAGVSREPVIAAILTGLFGLVGAVAAMMPKASGESRGAVASGAAAFLFSLFLANSGSTINRTEIEMFDRCIEMLVNPDVDEVVIGRVRALCDHVNALPARGPATVFLEDAPEDMPEEGVSP